MIKATGFFFAVFLSMLAVFLVATGEVKRWFSAPRQPQVLMSFNPAAGEGERTNIFDFDFWDARQGRRKFTIRGILNQEALEKTGRIESLDEIALEDGVITIPVYEGKTLLGTDSGEVQGPKRFELFFKHGVYRRNGGLARGGGKLEGVLTDGVGRGSDGTEFAFKELRFVNDPKKGGSGRFDIVSSTEVSIENALLRVESPSGLEGTLTDSGGLERLVFLPPVYTYLKSEAAGLFGLEKAPQDLERAESASSTREVVVTCQGPLELLLRPQRAVAQPEGGERNPSQEGRRKFVTFRRDVRIYEVAERVRGGSPPPPEGNWFHCQLLELTVVDKGDRLVPARAVASWPGGRVRAYVLHGEERYVLECEKLLWRRLEGEGAAERSEIELAGSPTLSGGAMRLEAAQAFLEPHSDVLRLEKVKGELDSGSRDGARRRSHSKALELLGGNDLKPETAEEDLPSANPLEEGISFEADHADVHFRGGDKKSAQEISHVVARSDVPRGVKVRSRPRSGDRTSTFTAEASLLKYREQGRHVALQGDGSLLPRLRQGTTWVEAENIQLFLDEGLAWFEERVAAHVEQPARGRGSEESEEEAAGLVSQAFELEADYLVAAFRPDGRVERARARGTPGRPVKLHALGGGGWRLQAPEIRLDTAARVVRLFGEETKGVLEPATARFEGGVARARTIEILEKKRSLRLRDHVMVRLEAGSGKREGQDLELEAAAAEVLLAGSSPEASGTKTVAGRLAAFETFHATGIEGERLVLRGPNFILRGEEMEWERAQGRLRFFGPGMQEIEIIDEDLRGPVRAREVVYSPGRGLLVLRGSVAGALEQRGGTTAGRTESDARQAGGTEGERPLHWAFETSVLELNVAEDKGPALLRLDRLRARDKVVLWNAEDGLRLRGDDLIYEHGTRTVRVFSEDGRPQTLTHYKEPDLIQNPRPGGNLPGGPEGDRAVDRILAQEIWLRLYERNRGSAMDRVIVADFRRDVNATFFMTPRGDLASLGYTNKDRWRLQAERLTLHFDPTAGRRSPRKIPWALAQGNVVCSVGAFQATADRLEYEEALGRIRLLGTRQRPATVVNTAKNLSEAAVVMDLIKRGDDVVVDYPDPGKALALPPWPGVPGDWDATR